jgi:hypothetical protein
MVLREGQARGVPQLATKLVRDLDEEEAMTLARIGAAVTRAESILLRKRPDEIELIGLYDRSRPAEGAIDTSRFSLPPPPVEARERIETRISHHLSIKEIFEPRRGSRPPSAPDGPPKIREPARALFLPVAAAVLERLAAAVKSYSQALFILTIIEDAAGKKRLIVGIVVLDDAGLLRAVDPSAELVEASGRMVEADAHDGNGPWRKLSARITPKPDGGATLHVDVR